MQILFWHSVKSRESRVLYQTRPLFGYLSDQPLFWYNTKGNFTQPMSCNYSSEYCAIIIRHALWGENRKQNLLFRAMHQSELLTINWSHSPHHFILIHKHSLLPLIPSCLHRWIVKKVLHSTSFEMRYYHLKVAALKSHYIDCN